MAQIQSTDINKHRWTGRVIGACYWLLAEMQNNIATSEHCVVASCKAEHSDYPAQQ